MTYLSDAQLAYMRSQVSNLLPDTCIIKEDSNSVDSAGAPIPGTTAVSGGTVSCRLDPVGSRATDWVVSMGQDILVRSRQLTIPYDAPISENSVIEIDSTDYEVLQLDDDHSWRVVRRAIVKYVE